MNWEWKKLTCIVILILVSNIILPSLSAKAQSGGKYIDYQVDSYGKNGIASHAVKLPRQKAEQLQHCLDDFVSELNNVSTDSGAKVVFYHALQRFKEYGVISGETYIKILQRFLTYRSYPIMKKSSSSMETNISNRFCLIALREPFIGMVSQLQMRYLRTVRYDEPYFNLGWFFWQTIDADRRFFIGAQIRFGWGDTGWLSTLGLLGFHYGTGVMNGLIPIKYPNGNSDTVGVTGFIGIRIMPYIREILYDKYYILIPEYAFGIADKVNVSVTV